MKIQIKPFIYDKYTYMLCFYKEEDEVELEHYVWYHLGSMTGG